MLDDVEHVRAGTHGSVSGSGIESGESDFFNLKGNDIRAAGEVRNGFNVIKRSLEARVNNKAGRTGGVGIENLDAITERARGHSGHSSELAPSDDADGGAGEDGCAGRQGV